MQRRFGGEHRWAVVLAGGDGSRLRSLSRLASGDDRPKQFCTFFGGQSLLAHTRRRIEEAISPERTLFVVLRSHESFYSNELQNVPSDRIIIQPRNRGTLAAFLYSLSRLVQLDPQAAVAFFPSDHYYSDEDAFRAGVDLAFCAAENNPKSIVLLGAPAAFPATDYGWVEAESGFSARYSIGVLRVKRFWEKPSRQVAEMLLDRGCVWNTFVMVGCAKAFLKVIRSGAPDIYCDFRPVLDKQQPEDEASVVKEIYDSLPLTDLSRHVLSVVPEKLGVLCLGNTGWCDLGDPQRIIDILIRNGEGNGWLGAA